MIPGYLFGLDLVDLCTLASVLTCGASVAFGAARLLAGTPAAVSLESLGAELDSLTDELVWAMSLAGPDAMSGSVWPALN